MDSGLWGETSNLPAAGTASAGLVSVLVGSVVAGAVAGSATRVKLAGLARAEMPDALCLPAGAAAGASVLVGSVAGAAVVLVGAAAASASFLGFFLKMFFSLPFRLSRASRAVAERHVSWLGEEDAKRRRLTYEHRASWRWMLRTG